MYELFGFPSLTSPPPIRTTPLNRTTPRPSSPSPRIANMSVTRFYHVSVAGSPLAGLISPHQFLPPIWHFEGLFTNGLEINVSAATNVPGTILRSGRPPHLVCHCLTDHFSKMSSITTCHHFPLSATKPAGSPAPPRCDDSTC